MKASLACAKRYKSWTADNWKRIIFSKKSNLFVQGYKGIVVRRSNCELLRLEHAQQTVKHPLKQMFILGWEGLGRSQEMAL